MHSAHKRAVLVPRIARLAALTLVAGLLSSCGGRSGPTPFNHLVTKASVEPTSASFASVFIRDYQTHYGAVAVAQGMPIMRVGPDQPTVNVAVTPGCGDFRSGTGPVPIPPAAASTADHPPDYPLVVAQASTDTEWELWQAHPTPGGGWTACWGGRLDHESATNGVFPYPFGLSGSGISYLATTITELDVASGSINHTIGLDLPSCSSPNVAPADRTDCRAGPGQPAEGTVFRFPSDLAPPKGLTPFGLLVFRALQRYGMVLMDQAGAVQVQAEDPHDWALEGHKGVDPITTAFAGKPEYEQVASLPWRDLQVVPPSARW